MDDFESPGIIGALPVYYKELKKQLTFPLARMKNKSLALEDWKEMARAKALETLNAPPPRADFQMELLSEEDRGSYTARRILINITAFSRICGYLLVPKGEGPFPAMLLCHDHGAMHGIGKEKVIKPFHLFPSKLALADQWVGENYGGVYIGDALCERGYVCFSFDALNWSDRGGAGGDGQQAFAAMMFLLGSSYSGSIAWEDLYAAEFLAGLPFVDKRRVGAMGLSMGAYRSFQLAAFSKHIAAAACICWMTTIKGICEIGNNQTGGQSAFSMLHPDLSRYLDYADVASIACPKPMLHYGCLQDTLFPIPSVKEAYQKMREVWEYEEAGEKLVTKLWDSPHRFSLSMQEEAFCWLDQQLLS